MAYLVRITPRAERDFAKLYVDIDAEESNAALKWCRGLNEAVLSLQESPNRCPVTPEKKQLRHLLYGNKPHVYRVIFRVLEKRKQIEVVHVRLGAREKKTPSEFRRGSERVRDLSS